MDIKNPWVYKHMQTTRNPQQNTNKSFLSVFLMRYVSWFFRYGQQSTAHDKTFVRFIARLSKRSHGNTFVHMMRSIQMIQTIIIIHIDKQKYPPRIYQCRGQVYNV